MTSAFYERFKRGVWEVVTEPDNKTVCPVRLMAIAGFVQFSVMAGYNMHHTHVFDVQAHALAYAALIGGIGAALGLKKDSPQGSSQ